MTQFRLRAADSTIPRWDKDDVRQAWLNPREWHPHIQVIRGVFLVIALAYLVAAVAGIYRGPAAIGPEYLIAATLLSTVLELFPILRFRRRMADLGYPPVTLTQAQLLVLCVGLGKWWLPSYGEFRSLPDYPNTIGGVMRLLQDQRNRK